jgi:hypothetical protein
MLTGTIPLGIAFGNLQLTVLPQRNNRARHWFADLLNEAFDPKGRIHDR